MRSHCSSICRPLSLSSACLAAVLALPPAPAQSASTVAFTAPEALVLLADHRPGSLRAFARALETAGGHAAVFHSPGAAIVFADDAALARPAVRDRIRASWREALDGAALAALDPEDAAAGRAWNEALRLGLAGEFEAEAEALGQAPGGPPLPDAGPRPVALEAVGSGLSAQVSDHLPYGAQYYDTSEFLAGTVAVGVWLLESDTHTYDWSPAEESATLGGIDAALANWARKGGAPAALTFYLDIHTQVPVTGEPIEHPQGDDDVFINEALGNLGWPGSTAFTKCFAYNNAIRDTFDTHWCYSIVVVDSDPAVNLGLFSGGGYAWAYYGGPWVYMSRYSTWAYNSASYAGVVPMHETGHIFMATDEYNSALEYGGYLNVQDSPSFVHCIMNRNDSLQVCQPTRGQLGLWDTDGDGALDVMDVEPTTELLTLPADSTTDATPTWTGSAHVNPLDNLNPLSNYYPPHDQTIATIDAVEFRVDGGVWDAATADDGAFDGYVESFSWTPPVPLGVGGHIIECRAHTSVGVWNAAYSADTVVILSLAAVPEPPARGGFALHAPRPNPARGPVRIGFRLPAEATVEIAVLDVAGRVVCSLADGRILGAGEHVIRWDASDANGGRLPPGVYLVRARAGGETALGRVLLLR